MSAVVVGAPMRGWAGPLDEAPDPVFAERMMGDGLAIDPLEGLVRAPCDATVIAVAPTRHSVTLGLANGAELLIHVGLETVALAGDGFVAHVAEGARVAAGDALIGFDLDAVARRAKSLISPVVIANEGFALRPLALGRAVEMGEPLFEVDGNGVAAIAPVGDDTAMCELVVPMANGVHARPAARIAAALKPFAAEVTASAHGRSANARSTVGLLGLGLGKGDRLLLSARGADARQAVTMLCELIESGMGEAEETAAPVPAAVPAPAGDGPVFRGVCASPGLAVGPAFQFRAADLDVPEQGYGAGREQAELDAVRAGLSAELLDSMTGGGGGIAAAHRALLDDPELLAGARRHIAEGKSAAFAWRAATRAACDAIRATGDRLLIERVADLVDVERQLIARLMGVAPPAPDAPEGAVLIAAELLPSQFMALDPARLAGICTVRGGPTSHVAILAASAGVPMLVAAGEGVLAVPDGRRVLLDSKGGAIDTEPGAEELAAVEARIAAERARRTAEAADAQRPCVTADGVRIEVFANLGSVEDARVAVAAGAEGCGLLRTEFLFLDRATAPDEAEQAATYAAVAEALGRRPLIVRTLDIGGDKPAPYLPFAPEENPALGLRGVRLTLARPELLAGQLRAIVTGVPADQCRIMLPMLVERAELRQVRALLDQARAAVGAPPVPLGVMIETPAAALLADSIAAEADFLSIGSNDLTQYALAADRGNPALAGRLDPLHPAVLRLIAAAAEGAAKHKRWLGVCGGVASDPVAAPVLIGLGVTELSAAPAAIPAVKAAVRRLRLPACRALAEKALAAASAAEVRALVKEAL